MIVTFSICEEKHAFAVLVVIVPAIMLHFKREFLSAFDALTLLFQAGF